MVFLNKRFIFNKLKENKITDEELKGYALTLNTINYRISRNKINRIFMIKLSLILKCPIKKLFINPNGNIFDDNN